MKDNALFQRLSYLYDAITLGTLAGHQIDLSGIYCQPLEGAVAFIGDHSLYIMGDGFSITYQEIEHSAKLGIPSFAQISNLGS